MMWWMTNDTTHKTRPHSDVVDEQLEEAIMAVLVLSWFGRHIGLFGAKGRHVGADFKSVIWMFGLFKIF